MWAEGRLRLLTAVVALGGYDRLVEEFNLLRAVAWKWVLLRSILIAMVSRLVLSGWLWRSLWLYLLIFLILYSRRAVLSLGLWSRRLYLVRI